MSNENIPIMQNDLQNAKKPIFKKWWFWLIIVLAVLLIIGIAVGTSGKDTSKPSGSSTGISSTEKAETIKISSVDLLAAYDDNAVKADTDYKDKLLEVSGVVKNIDKDVLNDVYVTINDGGELSIIAVQCYFEDEDEITKTANLKAGDEVTIIGTCSGKTINVMLKDCKIK